MDLRFGFCVVTGFGSWLAAFGLWSSVSGIEALGALFVGFYWFPWIGCVWMLLLGLGLGFVSFGFAGIV